MTDTVTVKKCCLICRYCCIKHDEWLCMHGKTIEYTMDEVCDLFALEPVMIIDETEQ